MQRLLLFLIPLCAFCLTAGARGLDSTRRTVPEISYRRLDSVIKSSEYTAVLYWPTWCSGCRPKMSQIIDLMAGKPGITLISVNDPHSKNELPRSLVQYPQVVKGAYRIQRFGPQREWFAVNSAHSQHRYFNWYYTRTANKEDLIENLRLLLFDKTGKLLYYTRGESLADSLRVALLGYH